MRKDNVRFGGIRPEGVVAMVIAKEVFKRHKEVFVLTSVIDGTHRHWSYHRAGYAFDCRKPVVKIGEIVNDLRHDLGPEFDVVVESDHLHVEFDVRKQGVMHERSTDG